MRRAMRSAGAGALARCRWRGGVPRTRDLYEPVVKAVSINIQFLMRWQRKNCQDGSRAAECCWVGAQRSTLNSSVTVAKSQNPFTFIVMACELIRAHPPETVSSQHTIGASKTLPCLALSTQSPGVKSVSIVYRGSSPRQKVLALAPVPPLCVLGRMNPAPKRLLLGGQRRLSAPECVCAECVAALEDLRRLGGGGGDHRGAPLLGCDGRRSQQAEQQREQGAAGDDDDDTPSRPLRVRRSSLKNESEDRKCRRNLNAASITGILLLVALGIASAENERHSTPAATTPAPTPPGTNATAGGGGGIGGRGGGGGGARAEGRQVPQRPLWAAPARSLSAPLGQPPPPPPPPPHVLRRSRALPAAALPPSPSGAESGGSRGAGAGGGGGEAAAAGVARLPLEGRERKRRKKQRRR